MASAPQLQHHVSLRPYNTFGLDAKARLFAAFASVDELRALLLLPEVQAAPKLVLGGGSNLLLTQDFDGVVLKNEIRGLEILAPDTADDTTVLVRAGAGESWHGLVEYTLGQALAGIENLSLIPGTVGAAPLQNIGAYGVELQDAFEFLEAMDLQGGPLRRFTREECGFGYRESVFKNALRGQYIVTAVVLRLHRVPRPASTSYGAIRTTLEEMGVTEEPTPQQVSQAVISIRRSKLPDPAQIGNAGSFFKNPEVSQAKFDSLKAQHPDIPGYPVPGGVKVPAGWLIEQCGWKGHRAGEGRYGVHDRQALVLVNHGGATGGEVRALAEDIIASVREKFGIELHPEVNII